MKTSKLMKLINILLLLLSFKGHASIELKNYSVSAPATWKVLKLKGLSTLKIAFEAPSEQSTFTIREFNKIKEPSLKKNVRSWLIDYRSYGFTLTKNRPLKLNKKTYGYLIEAIHKNSKKVFKQYMSIHTNKLVTLTCHSNRINDEFKTCSDSLKTFSWK